MRSVFVAGALTLAACNAPAGDSATDEVSECVRRGVKYFKEIGSYPTLSAAPNKGRAAEDVAIERCNRTTTAFP